jgi:hypothetical protein
MKIRSFEKEQGRRKDGKKEGKYRKKENKR